MIFHESSEIRNVDDAKRIPKSVSRHFMYPTSCWYKGQRRRNRWKNDFPSEKKLGNTNSQLVIVIAFLLSRTQNGLHFRTNKWDIHLEINYRFIGLFYVFQPFASKTNSIKICLWLNCVELKDAETQFIIVFPRCTALGEKIKFI